VAVVTDRPGAPEDDLAGVAEAQARFSAAIEGLSDADARRPSRLDGWTVGHVLTHVARNADSHVRRAEAAARAETVDQYPGGFEGRAAEIDAGAGRPARQIVEDVRTSAGRLDAAWRQVPPAAWDVVSRDVGGTERPLRSLPARRWQELEVHLVDLDLAVTYREWPDAFVGRFLPVMRPTAGPRLAEGDGLPRRGALDEREELAWLYGRLVRPDLPELAPWG